MSQLVVGAVYETASGQRARYVRDDHCFGQRTHEFRLEGVGGLQFCWQRFVLPEQLDSFLAGAALSGAKP